MAGRLSGIRALIVDDEVDLAEILALCLTLQGVEVEVASSGEQGLLRFQARPCDLVISDIRMPNGDGMWLCNQLMSGQGERPSVLLISGFSEVDNASAKAAGAFGILAKPFSFEQLIAAIEEALRCKRSPQ